MKVIVDNHSLPEFNVQVRCSSCHSELLIDHVNDLVIGHHLDGDQRTGENWDVRHLEFQCPLCLKYTRVPDEKKFPEPVTRFAYARK